MLLLEIIAYTNGTLAIFPKISYFEIGNYCSKTCCWQRMWSLTHAPHVTSDNCHFDWQSHFFRTSNVTVFSPIDCACDISSWLLNCVSWDM